MSDNWIKIISELKTKEYFIDYYKKAPETELEDDIDYYAYNKIYWSAGVKKPEKNDLKELVEFQKAMESLGYSERFLNKVKEAKEDYRKRFK